MSEHKSATPQTKLQRVHTFIDVVRRALKARDDAKTEQETRDAMQLENESRSAAFAAVKLIIANKIELREPGGFTYHDERKPPAPPTPPPTPPPASRRYVHPEDFVNELFRAAGMPPPRAHRPAPPRPPPASTPGADWERHRDQCFACSTCFSLPHIACEEGWRLHSIAFPTSEPSPRRPAYEHPWNLLARHLDNCARCLQAGARSPCTTGRKLRHDAQMNISVEIFGPLPTPITHTDRVVAHQVRCGACMIGAPCDEGEEIVRLAVEAGGAYYNPIPPPYAPGDRTAPRRPTITINGVMCPLDEVNVKWSPRPSSPPEAPREYSATYTGGSPNDRAAIMLNNHAQHCQTCRSVGRSACPIARDIARFASEGRL